MFTGAWTSCPFGAQIQGTICGWYAGLANAGRAYAEWGIEQGQAKDGGSAYSNMAGLRSKWFNVGELEPFQIGKEVSSKAAKILRAYTGTVIQASGSSPVPANVYFLANGCWEQVYASTWFVRSDIFEPSLSVDFRQKGRGIDKIHMADLITLKAKEGHLTYEVTSWNGSHPKFLDGVYTIKEHEFSSFKGSADKGDISEKVPYVDIDKRDQIAAVAKVRDYIGGWRSVRTVVVDQKYETHKGPKITEYSTDLIFTATEEEVPTPKGLAMLSNVFVVNAPGQGTPVESALFDLDDAQPPKKGITYADRTAKKRGVLPSVEVYPDKDGKLARITEVVVTTTTIGMQLAISVENSATTRKVPFMPVSTLLVDRLTLVRKVHDKVAASGYGYGYLPTDSYNDGDDIPHYNRAPGDEAFSSQERWHVPYKELIGESWRLAVGAVSTVTFSSNGVAQPNPYVYAPISSIDTSNRYTLYDLQVRPFTFLPLFMSAEVCHEGGATAFAVALSEGLIKHLNLVIEGENVNFTSSAPSWATVPEAFYKSIMALLVLGTRKCTSYTVKSGAVQRVSSTTGYTFDVKGAPSADFWTRIAKATGLAGMSDLVTHYGVTNGTVNVARASLLAAAIKDPVGFGASMGVTVLKDGAEFVIGTERFSDLEAVTDKLVDIAALVVAKDTTNPRNAMTVLGIGERNTIPANPKRYVEPFNPLNLIPHVVVGGAVIGTTIGKKH